MENNNTNKFENSDLLVRSFAMMLDILILALFINLLSITTSTLLWFLFESFVFFVIISLYFLFFRYFFQASIGKLLFGIKIVSFDNSKIDISTIVTRYIGYVLNVLTFGLGFLRAFIDKNQQGLHDKLAFTKVIKNS